MSVTQLSIQISKALTPLHWSLKYLHFCGASVVKKGLHLFKAAKHCHIVRGVNIGNLSRATDDSHTKHWQIWSIEAWSHRHAKCTSTSMCSCRNTSFSVCCFQCVHMWLNYEFQTSQESGCISWKLSFCEVPSMNYEDSRRYFWNSINDFLITWTKAN